MCTYGEFNTRVNRLAHALAARGGQPQRAEPAVAVVFEGDRSPAAVAHVREPGRVVVAQLDRVALAVADAEQPRKATVAVLRRLAGDGPKVPYEPVCALELPAKLPERSQGGAADGIEDRITLAHRAIGPAGSGASEPAL